MTAIGEVRFERDQGWYTAGSVKIISTTVDLVNLRLEQPEVRLSTCIDSSGTSTRYQATGKPVPGADSNGDRHKFRSRLVLAPPVAGGNKMWFLIEEKAMGSC
jgi:hypothetical protein